MDTSTREPDRGPDRNDNTPALGTQPSARTVLAVRAAGCLALIAGMLALCGAGHFAHEFSDSLTDQRALRSAHECGFGESSRNCLRRIDTTVADGHPEGLVFTLDGPVAVAGEYRLSNPPSTLEDLRSGEHVTVTVWQGRRTAITRESTGGTRLLPDAPQGRLPLHSAMVLILLNVAGCALSATWWCLWRTHELIRPRGIRKLWIVARTTLGLALVAAGIGYIARDFASLVPILIFWPVAAVLFVSWNRRRSLDSG